MILFAFEVGEVVRTTYRDLAWREYRIEARDSADGEASYICRETHESGDCPDTIRFPESVLVKIGFKTRSDHAMAVIQPSPGKGQSTKKTMEDR